ncbi:MAG TPA: MlaD family protein [Burkholderiales bacterium]|nr:MlaD family protein [Burkholderiales bacterium]
MLFFGGGMLREKRFSVVSFFDVSVAGMRVGAPVTFRGVPVGEVKSLGVRLDPKTGRSIIQVNMELVPGMLTVYGQAMPESEMLITSLVNEGLTAQLVKQSFVTGLLSVELAFRPGAEVSRLGDAALPEVPTVPGDLEGLAKQLQTVDIAAALESLQRTLVSVEKVASNPGLARALDQLPATLGSLERTLGTMQREVGASSAEFQKTLAGVRSLAASVERDTASTSAALRGTLANADAVLADTQTLVDPRGHNAIQLQRMLDDFAAASARLRNLAERVDRDPSVLVRGR